ncbi:hypothetical protein [Bacillus pseudomycoides]|uniref:hypothetical protein n=1 Tax=Bacillus pseudomycoides TaxID=64104 RepID=UPI003D6626AD
MERNWESKNNSENDDKKEDLIINKEGKEKQRSIWETVKGVLSEELQGMLKEALNDSDIKKGDDESLVINKEGKEKQGSIWETVKGVLNVNEELQGMLKEALNDSDIEKDDDESLDEQDSLDENTTGANNEVVEIKNKERFINEMGKTSKEITIHDLQESVQNIETEIPNMIYRHNLYFSNNDSLNLHTPYEELQDVYNMVESLREQRDLLRHIENKFNNPNWTCSVDWINDKPDFVEYERLKGTGVFVNFESEVNEDDKDLIISQLKQIGEDSLAQGLKIRVISDDKMNSLENDKIWALYSHSKDRILYCPRGAKYRDNCSILYHELGHRTHNIKEHHELTDTEHERIMEVLKKGGFSIKGEDWGRNWDPLFDIKLSTQRRFRDLKDKSDPLYRLTYPFVYLKTKTKEQIPAYKKFKAEMFAEMTAIYFERDKELYKLVDKEFKGLLAFMEKVYGRGYYQKDSDIKTSG